MDGSSRPRAPQPPSPDRGFSFTDWQTSNPTAPPPGDKLDTEFDRTNQAVQGVIDWVSVSLNPDGSLVEPPAGVPPPDTGGAALAFDYAEVSAAWAEHMPDTIPPNILAFMGITGDHWSARWWANRAAQIVQNAGGGGGFVEAPLDGHSYGRQNANWVTVLNINDGGTVGGPLTLSSSFTVNGVPTFNGTGPDGAVHIRSATDWPGVVFDINNAASGAFIRTNRSGAPRWITYHGDDSPDIGGNVGTNYKIQRFKDDGTSDFPFEIVRATGEVLLNGLAPVVGAPSVAQAANVVAFGADPTGVGDSTPAFIAASTQDAPDGTHCRAMYVPAGTYRVTSLVPLSGVMFGDGRNSSVILIDDRFDNHGAATPASPGVFGLNSIINPTTGKPQDTGTEVRDIGIQFVQPSTGCARANFKTLAAGGTVATGVMYPPAFIVQSTARHKLIDVRVSCAWDGISTAGKNCVLYLDNLEMCALNVGLGMGVGTAPGVGVGLKDVCHIKSYHFFPFDITNHHLADDLFNGVFWDGNTIAAQFGEVDGLDVGSFFSFVGRVIFVQDATWGAEKGSYFFNNLILDTDATLEINAANTLHINNFSANSEVKCQRALVKVAPPPGVRARVQFGNWDMGTGSGHIPLSISGAAADVTMTNGRLIPSNPAINAISITDGILRMFGAKIRPSGAGIWSGSSSIGSLDAVPIAAGGNGAQVGDTFTDPNGGHYTATAVSAGVVTAVRLDKAPTIFGTAPSNPVALTSINNNTPSLASFTPVAGGLGYLLGDVLKDNYGNRYTVTGVGGTSGTVITAINLTTVAVWFANFPPANPVALIDTAGGGIGAGASVNLNWVNHVTTAAGVTVNLDWAARVSNVSSMPSSTPVTAGGVNLVGDRLTDAYGNRYTVQAVDQFAGVTSLSLDTARVFVGATPSNPVALTAELPALGVGVTVYLTWTTSPAGTSLIAQGGTGVLQLDDIDIGGNVNGKDNDTSSGIAIAINTDMPGTRIGKVTLGDNWSWHGVAHSAQPGAQIDWLPTTASYPDDASASAAGVGVGQFYRNGNVMLIRAGSAAGSPIALPATTAPIVEGIAAPGTLLAYARADHIHPAAAPPFVPAAATITPIVEGVGNAGTLLTYARGDHVHPASGSSAWVPAGQPNGTTDNTAALQAAINAAAGHGAITVPASTNNYIVGTVTIPSNTHLIIEAGATLFLKSGTNADMLAIANGASNVQIDLYGTLDGNTAGQTTGTSGGIGGSNGASTNVFVRGARQGTIKNFRNWPVNITSCTNGEVSGVIIHDCGNSCEFAGLSRTVTTATSGTYTSGTGAVSITTAAPHGIAVGAEFSLTNATATGSVVVFSGGYFATAGTSGTTLNYVSATGAGASTLTFANVRTCTKCYNVGFSDCVVSNINDLGICLYGGVVNGYIRDCETFGGVGVGPSFLSDAAQPGINIGCEISRCVAHDHITFGILITSNISGSLPLNSRIFNNHSYNNYGGIYIEGDGVECCGNLLENNILTGTIAGQVLGDLLVANPNYRVNVWGNTIRNACQGGTTGYGIAVNSARYCRVAQNIIGDYQTTPSMLAAIGGSFTTRGVTEGNYYGPRINSAADTATYAADCLRGISYDMSGANGVGGVFVTGVGSVIFAGQMTLASNIAGLTTFPIQGLTTGWNRSAGRGEINLMIGQGGGSSGGLNIEQVTAAGTINAGVGVAGSLLALDGYGNVRLGGAICNGVVQKTTIANAGTLLVNPNTSMVIVTNAASIAACTITLPAASANSYSTTYQELEILYVSAIGALTVNAAGTFTVQNAPTAMVTPSGSHRFTLDGALWRRKISS